MGKGKDDKVDGADTSGYDEDKDVTIRELVEVRVDGAKTYITAAVRCYDGGPEKVEIARWAVAKDKYVALRRLTIDEAKGLGKLLKKL